MFLYLKKWLCLLTIQCSLWCGWLWAEEGNNSFTVAVLGAELGALEPCGCVPGMLGGMARRETAVRSLQAKQPPVIVLHNGGLLDHFGPQAQLKREAQAQALNRISVSAMGVGLSEFFLGPDSLAQFQKQVSFPLVCSNVEKAPLSFEREWRTELSAGKQVVSIRVFSLVSATLQREWQRFIPGVEITSPDEKMRQWGAKKENEFWALLFQGPANEAQNLALKNPALNLVICTPQEEAPYAIKLGNAQVVSTGLKGRYFMSLKFQAAPPFALVQSERIVLNDQYKDAPDAQRIILKYKEKLKKEEIAERTPRVKWFQGAGYAGSQACAKCHRAEFETWKKSRHARALENLAPENHDRDPQCLVCHSTGFGFESGFVSREKTTPLANVSCETCHGPGSLHTRAPKENKTPLTASPATCAACHDAENSPRFDFEKYWPQIQHGK